jgi:hypothetical protein
MSKKEWHRERRKCCTASNAGFLFKNFSQNADIMRIMQDVEVYTRFITKRGWMRGGFCFIITKFRKEIIK